MQNDVKKITVFTTMFEGWVSYASGLLVKYLYLELPLVYSNLRLQLINILNISNFNLKRLLVIAYYYVSIIAYSKT